MSNGCSPAAKLVTSDVRVPQVVETDATETKFRYPAVEHLRHRLGVKRRTVRFREYEIVLGVLPPGAHDEALGRLGLAALTQDRDRPGVQVERPAAVVGLRPLGEQEPASGRTANTRSWWRTSMRPRSRSTSRHRSPHTSPRRMPVIAARRKSGPRVSGPTASRNVRS